MGKQINNQSMYCFDPAGCALDNPLLRMLHDEGSDDEVDATEACYFAGCSRAPCYEPEHEDNDWLGASPSEYEHRFVEDEDE